MNSSTGKVRLTGIFGVLGANVVVACVEDIFVHERRAGCDLSEEGNLDGLTNLDSLAFLYEDLARVLAAVLAVERWHTVLLGMVALFEWLERGHEVVPTCDAMCDDTFCDTGGDGTLDDGSDRVHGSDNLGLELWRHMELDLLEEVFRCTESTHNKDVLSESAYDQSNLRVCLPVMLCSVPE